MVLRQISKEFADAYSLEKPETRELASKCLRINRKPGLFSLRRRQPPTGLKH
jgi:hypothetical protein